MNHILDLIEKNLWDEALKLFMLNSEELTEESCIIGATIMEHFGEHESAFSFIKGGLKLNPCNYELYLLLGNYYRSRNMLQAYLAYENALYHCINNGTDADRSVIEQIINDIDMPESGLPNKVSFVILSYNTLHYTKLCILSIRATCYSNCYEIIVVDNASSDGSAEWLSEQDDIILIKNDKNTGFPAGCNQGIKAANPDNDIFLLNSDTVMLHNSLFWLRVGLYDDEQIGASGAVSNYAANGQCVRVQCDSVEDYMQFGSTKNIPELHPYEEKSYLIMFAMLIKRECLNAVGLLDERFTPGNFEDNDYGLRIVEKGYKNILCHNSYIVHYGSKSFGADKEYYSNIYVANRENFKNKWGFYMDYYNIVREDVISMIDFPSESEFSVIEIGCGLGETLAKIKYKYPNSSVSGIEIVENIAKIGNKRFEIISGDIETISLDRKYDIILFPDVLEQLREPEKVLISLKSQINKNGCVICSLPNLMNASIIYDLMRGDFTYQDAGILDRTHLRFFTLNEIKQMFERTGYEIIDLVNIVFPNYKTDTHKEFFDQLLSIKGVASKELFDTYQFIIKAAPKAQESD